MTITASGEIKISDIASELGRPYGGNTSIGLGDWSGKLWKGGPGNNATFKEIRYYGSNCEASVATNAQGLGLRDLNSPYAELSDNNVGLNATQGSPTHPGASLSEWYGYNHNGVLGGADGRSTIGVKPGSTNGLPRLGGNPPGSAGTNVVVHGGEYEYDESFSYINTMKATSGLQIYCYKTDDNGGTVKIDVKRGLFPFANYPGTTNVAGGTDLVVLGPNSGAGQTTTVNYAPGSSTVTICDIVGADRITGCSMSLEGSMPSDGPDQYTVKDPDTMTTYGGSKVETVTGGATSTVNLGATLIGYDLCCGGWFYMTDFDTESVARTYGVEFTFTATNNEGTTMDTHKITVYASLYAEAENDVREW